MRRVLLVAGAAALGVLAAACGRGAGELQLTDIKRGDLVIGVVVTGELAAVDSTDIKPPALEIWNFKIASLADDGVDVKLGEPVVGFDASEQMREHETVKNEALSAKKKLEKKLVDAALARREEELAIANAEAVLRKATLKADTPGDLVASVDLRALQLDQRGAQIALGLAKDKAAQTRRSDEAELSSLRDKLAYATRRAEQLGKNIAKMQIVAPRAGTVVYPTSWRGEKKKVGDSAWRMEVVLQIVGLDKMIGKGEVDEVDVARVAAKQPVSLRLDALPDVQLLGRVTNIARSVRPKSEAVPSKVVEIKFALDPTKAPLRPGMRFRGEVETERVANVVQIPIDAVFVTAGGPVAYRDRGGGVEAVPLVLGRRSSTMIEVTSGVEPGDRVSRSDPAGRHP
jgi:HlyD family secretion protein